MSQLNGDKARFGRDRKKKMLRRELSRASRLDAKPTELAAPSPVEAETTTEPTESTVKSEVDKD